MARLAAMTASSAHRTPCGPPPPPPHHPHPPSSVVSIAARMCPNASATNWDSGVGRKRKGLAANASGSGCFRKESTPHTSAHLRRLPRCHDSWEQRGNDGGLWLSRWRRTTSLVCRGGAGGRGKLEAEQVELEGQDEDPRLLALEAEIYDFMLKSSKPTHFPTKDELIAAGRMDLVEAIAEHGGYLAYGCDFDDDVEEAAGSDDSYGDHEDGGDGVEGGGQLQGREWRADAISSLPLETDPATVVMEDNDNEVAVGWQDNEVLQQQREVNVGEESGIEGILNRLEKERSFAFLEADDRISSKSKDYDSAAGDSGTLPYGNRYGADNFLSNIHVDALLKQSINDTRSGSTEPKPSAGDDRERIHSHLQFLESELNSVLSLFRSRTDAVVPQKEQEGSLKDLNKLSDALEFQETEIMNAQDKRRSIRAKLVAFEGKMALDMVEAQKILEEKQKRLDAAQKALCLLHTAYVVWPNAASKVFLAGSFDGWTSQIEMEKSSTGIFSLYLKLYPGQYEIKFIVDGVWKVDQLRPVVYNDGHENNLLIIQ